MERREKDRGEEKKEGSFLIEENLSQKDHRRISLLYYCLGIGHMVTPGCNGGCPGMCLPKGRGAATTIYTVVIQWLHILLPCQIRVVFARCEERMPARQVTDKESDLSRVRC